MKWMLTFGDMMTNLLVFFVLLISMASLDQGKVKETLNSMRGALGVMESSSESAIPKFSDKDITESYINILNSDYVNRVKEAIDKLKKDKNIEMKLTKSGLGISLPSDLLFEPGSAELNRSSVSILDNVLEFLKLNVDKIEIQGFTDNSPINNASFSSNWDLSSIRAVNVVTYLIKRGKMDPRIFVPIGYGETKPLYPNVSPEFKAKNRRVEISIFTSSNNLLLIKDLLSEGK
ncbi:OmpA family protein [bacterium]|nr:OmpA family protein [bacterium]